MEWVTEEEVSMWVSLMIIFILIMDCLLHCLHVWQSVPRMRESVTRSRATQFHICYDRTGRSLGTKTMQNRRCRRITELTVERYIRIDVSTYIGTKIAEMNQKV